MTRIYLAGPMTGLPEFNHPAFNKAARELRALGYYVFNPAECNPVNADAPVGDRNEYRRALMVDLQWIASYADAIVLLPCWGGSKGVRAELALAECIGVPYYELAQFTHPDIHAWLNGGSAVDDFLANGGHYERPL